MVLGKLRMERDAFGSVFELRPQLTEPLKQNSKRGSKRSLLRGTYILFEN